MVFWNKEEFGGSDVELRVQELVQRSNVVDEGSQLRHHYKLYITVLRDTRSVGYLPSYLPHFVGRR